MVTHKDETDGLKILGDVFKNNSGNGEENDNKRQLSTI
jgi:hypothetical protein